MIIPITDFEITTQFAGDNFSYIKLYINKNTGNFIKGEVISIQQLGEGGPTIDPNRQVLNEIKRLCTVDFPEVPWLFNEDGSFRLK